MNWNIRQNSQVFTESPVSTLFKYGSLKICLKVFEYLRNTKYKKNSLQNTILKYFHFTELKYKIFYLLNLCLSTA